MTFFQEALQLIDPIYDAIKILDFNQAMMNGTLPFETYGYYLEQDNHYLKAHAKCDAIIVRNIPNEYKSDYSSSAIDTVKCIKENEQFFIDYNISHTGLLTTATQGYSSDLLSTCTTKPVEVSVAATLTCIWIYSELGLYLYQNSIEDNPYDFYISPYADPIYIKNITNLIEVANKLYASSDEKIKNEMLDVFYRNSVWEWHFWDDAYKKIVFDNLK